MENRCSCHHGKYVFPKDVLDMAPKMKEEMKKDFLMITVLLVPFPFY